MANKNASPSKIEREAADMATTRHRSKRISPMLLLTEDPLPQRSVAFYSKAEVNGFVHSVLHAITQELIPTGALAITGNGDYLRTRRIVADADIARRAMVLQLPQTADAVVRRNDNVLVDRLLAIVNDAHLVLSAMVPLLEALGQKNTVIEGGFAIRGNLLNTGKPLIRAIEKEFGADLETMRGKAKQRYLACGGMNSGEIDAAVSVNQARG